MRYRSFKIGVAIRLCVCFLAIAVSGAILHNTYAQSVNPLTSKELVALVYQLAAHPEKKDELVEEIRRRGIGFALTSGIRSVVATKSGNDALLRRTLEEAERRRLNPTASALPSETEGQDILAQARSATLTATREMPDFVVKQLITRSYARGATKNWSVSDRLTIAVSYREGAGEQYKLLAVNGLPTTATNTAGGENSSNYEQIGGTSSTGEFVSMLTALFAEESKARFSVVDTDSLRGRRALIFNFEVQKQNSKQTIKSGRDNAVITGYQGRVWIDRENYRVLRVEEISTEIPEDFPVTAASSVIDYDWVMITDRQYLLPSRAEVILTSKYKEQALQSRNEIRFRNYQKFGSEVKITDVDDEDVPPAEP